VPAPRVQVRPGLGSINPINNANVVQQPVKRLIPPAAATPKLTVTVPVTKSIPVTVAKTSPIVTSVSSINTRNKSKQLASTTESTPAKTISKGNRIRSSLLGNESFIEVYWMTCLSTVNDTNSAIVDLTDDDGKPTADSKEVSLSRYPGKIYPSLVVVARPSLRVKEMTSSTITAERTQLGEYSSPMVSCQSSNSTTFTSVFRY